MFERFLKIGKFGIASVGDQPNGQAGDQTSDYFGLISWECSLENFVSTSDFLWFV